MTAVGDRGDVDRPPRAAPHGHRGPRADRRFEVAGETGGAIFGSDDELGRATQHVRAVAAPIGDDDDVPRYGETGEGGREWQVAVRDHDMIDALAGHGVDPVVDRAVEA